MREVEIKAWVDDFDSVKQFFDSVSGPGQSVDKEDCYYRRPGEKIQAFRIRKNNGVLEFTTKINSKNEKGEENNCEYEFESSLDQMDKAKLFFENLGYEFFFEKIKRGFDWKYRGVHVELLCVEHVGTLLEMEALIPFDATDSDVSEAAALINSILDEVGIPKSKIEKRSYRSMILNRG